MTVRSVVVKLIADLGSYTPNIDKGARATDRFADSAEKTGRKHGEAWDRIGRGAAVASTIGVAAVGAMVKSYMDFDRTMSEVGAATKANQADLGRLRESALEAGKATVFSATEAAQAQIELAKAGVSTADILGGALTGALDLASAGGLDVADAASIAATAMTQFGLSGKEVPHIADLLAAGAGKAQGEVSDLGLALKYVGPVAHQMGISIEETTGVIAELASNGILADQAGTSLRGMLSSLTSPSEKAAAKMEELGINVYDTAGNFVGFDGVAGQLHDRLGKLTNVQRDQALGTLFGNEQVTAARILYAGGADAVQDWTKKVNDAGFAQEQAAAKLDNLSGDLEAFRGSVETALIQGGSAANGSLRVLVQTATGAVNVFADLPGPLQATAVGIVAVGAAGGGALAFFGAVVPKVRAYRAELDGMGRVGSVANTAIGVGGKVLGASLPVFALAATAVQVYNQRKEESARRVKTFTDAIIADNGALGENTRQVAVNTLEQSGALKAAQMFGLNLKDVTDAVLGNQAALGRINGVLDTYAAQIKLTAGAGAENNVATQAADEAYVKLKDTLGSTNSEVTKAVDAAKRQAAASGEQKTATDVVATTTKGYTGTIQDATGALQKYESAAEAVKASIDALNGSTLAAAESDIEFRNAVARASETLKGNGRTLDLNTQKGRDNRSAIIAVIKAANQHAQAVADQTGSVERGTKAFGADVGALKDNLRQHHLLTPAVDALIGSYGRVPKATKGAAKGLDGATHSASTAASKMDAVTRAANGIPKNITTTVTAKVNVKDVTTATLEGGAARGAGYGRGAVARATGGWVPGHSPGDYSDNIPATIGGKRPLWLTGEEFVINRPRARTIRQKAPGLLEAINAGTVDIGGDPSAMLASYGAPLKPVRLARGGSVPEVQRFFRSTDPLPYVWSAVGPYAYDCSGLAGEGFNRLTGRQSYHRAFTTSSNLAALGFRRGLGTFTIGLNPGKHMAVNLAGYGAEAQSTATGIKVGAAATPVTRFAQQWYLPQIGGRFVGAGDSLALTDRQKAQIYRLIAPQIARQLGDRIRNRASGGPVEAGQLYRVNERGQEGYFVPPANGSIVPSHQMTARTLQPAGAGGGTTVTIAPGAMQLTIAGGTGMTPAEVGGVVDRALQDFADRVAVRSVKGSRA